MAGLAHADCFGDPDPVVSGEHNGHYTCGITGTEACHPANEHTPIKFSGGSPDVHCNGYGVLHQSYPTDDFGCDCCGGMFHGSIVPPPFPKRVYVNGKPVGFGGQAISVHAGTMSELKGASLNVHV